MEKIIEDREYFIGFKKTPHLIGRIVITPLGQSQFTTEVDILFKKGQKIYSHVGCIYRVDNSSEALALRPADAFRLSYISYTLCYL